MSNAYLCEGAGPIPKGRSRRMRTGGELEGGPARVDGFRMVDANGRAALVEVILHEGRNHIVRRMFDEVGHPVSRLIRTAVGPIKLGELKPGRIRRLTSTEVAALFRIVED